MHKSSSSTSHNGSGGSLLSKAGSLFGSKTTVPSSASSSRPGTSSELSPQQSEQFLSQALASAGLGGFSSNRGSVSSRTSKKVYHPKAASVSATASLNSPERKTTAGISLQHAPSRSVSSASKKETISTQSSFDESPQQMLHLNNTTSPLSATESNKSASFAMLAAPFGQHGKKDSNAGKPPSTSQSNQSFGHDGSSHTPALPPVPSGLTGGLQNPNIIYQHIHDMASKRISTLDYLRKAHEGRIYWFNTLLFTKADLSRMPYFESKKLSRRATNYLLLGLSLPTILDHNSQNPTEYLRALNALLLEFESFQQIHPPDGTTSSSLSRARIPQMFKRAAAGTKSRRTSSATEIGLPMNSTSDPSDLKSMSGSMTSTSSSTPSSFPANEQELLPGEEYTHLLTPSLPFDPDFYQTFATLCDMLIDCYTRIISLISSPAICIPGVGEMFTKADGRVRKLIVGGVVNEFETASRSGVKAEVAGVGKVVLGGLM
ncbi:MAG: hypothetical protein M1812_007272 [Candelaria pacifica]|nr:MAG: hypothetical protein M1812_007272 [Candelaria pacifica]